MVDQISLPAVLVEGDAIGFQQAIRRTRMLAGTGKPMISLFDPFSPVFTIFVA